MTTLSLAPAARARVVARLGLAEGPAPAPTLDAPQPGSPDRSADLLAVLRTRAPAVFCDPPVPLAIGIRAAIVELVSGDFSAADVAHALSGWCQCSEYRHAVVAGAPRYALDGTIVGTVTDAEAGHAQHSPRRPRL